MHSGAPQQTGPVRRSDSGGVPVRLRAANLSWGLSYATWGLSGGAFVACLPTAAGQQPLPPALAPALPPEVLFKQAQGEIEAGRYDVAAETLKKFLAGNPSEAVYQSLTRARATTLLDLRKVVTWSDEPAANAEAKKTVEAVIAAGEAANVKLTRDPARIARFVRNLGESPEERVYAEQQLRLAGDAVVPVMVDTLRTTTDPVLRSGIVGAITALNADQLPGLLGASVGLPTELKLAILKAAVARPDLTALSASPDTDLMPHLWYFSATRREDERALREFASLTLDALTGGTFARRPAAAELVKLARPLATRQARFASGDRVKLWTFDPATSSITSVDATAAQASDYFAVRDLRWALDRAPGDPAAQELFLALTVERAVEKARFGDVLQADPNLLPVLAAAPSELLVGMLDRAMTDRRTALALGLTQVLSARSDKLAAGGDPRRPSVFVAGLDYPDARVQLAAAVGLLKVPGAVPAGKAARVVEVLRRAAAVEPAPAGTADVGRALIADPSDFRSERLAAHLRSLGYAAERFATGRDLARRVATAADADLIFVDRHVVNPELRDLLTAIRTDADAARRPLFVVASADKVAPVSADRLLLRLAYLVAVTETSEINVPAPFAFDPRRPVLPAAEPQRRSDIASTRDKLLGELYKLRLARLERLVAGANLPRTEALQNLLDIRLPQLTYAALAAEYPVTAASAPDTLLAFDTRTKLLLNNPRLTYSTRGLRTDDLSKLVEELDGALDAPRRQKFEGMLARTDPAVLGLPPEMPADPALTDRLDRVARHVGGVTVIPEVFSAAGLRDDIQKGVTDPAQAPVPAAVKRQNARLALEYLRRMAVGEIPGFDVRPAAPALRAALRDDEFADAAIDAVARLGTAEAQQDLLTVALGLGRPAPLRIKAADRAIQHVQAFGRLVVGPQLDALNQAAAAEPSPDLRGRLAILSQLLAAQPGDLSDLIRRFPLPVPAAVPIPTPEKKEVPADPAKPDPAAVPEKK